MDCAHIEFKLILWMMFQLSRMDYFEVKFAGINIK